MDNNTTLFILLGIVAVIVIALVIYKMILANRAVKIDRQILEAFFRQEFQLVTDKFQDVKNSHIEKVDIDEYHEKFNNFLNKSVDYINKQSEYKHDDKLSEIKLEFQTKYNNDLIPLYNEFVAQRDVLSQVPTGRLNRVAQYGLQAAAIGAQFLGKGLLGAATGTLGRGFSKNFQARADKSQVAREITLLETMEKLNNFESAHKDLLQEFITRIGNMKGFRLFG
ncbi:MAG: hypothetical protein Q4F57_07240 [Weeksellaceae bacterium]|nr:hypothetical protein [Weeksellaceae bacterium]